MIYGFAIGVAHCLDITPVFAGAYRQAIKVCYHEIISVPSKQT